MMMIKSDLFSLKNLTIHKLKEDRLFYKLEKMFEEMSPLQRSLFGVPLPGDKYWNLENIKLLKYRYLNIDVKPYLSKL